MRTRSSSAGWAAVLVGACLLVGGCTSPPSSNQPSSSPEGGGFALRATPVQPIPPQSLFSWPPYVFIATDGTVIRQGPVPDIFPGPLLPNLQAASITEAGYNEIVARADSLGLLQGSGDFTPVGMPLGGLTGIVELRVDGALRTITGDPNRRIECVTTPCDPEPGTPEAFGTFWMDLGNLEALVGDALGHEAAYDPDAYAVLIGVDPLDDQGLGRQVMTWPLATPLATTGVPVSDAPLPRCATITGEDAATLEPALAAANQLTTWVDDGADPASALSIAVRPVLPGEDPCQERFGVDA